jgi:hypothetical protein
MQAGRLAQRLNVKEIEMRVVIELGRLTLCASMCIASMIANAQTVTSFTVVNADTEADIATFKSSGSVSIAATPRINVRANTNGAGSVVFTDPAGGRRVESTAPYAYKGDTSGNYIAWSPVTGKYPITATPFSGSGGTGKAGPAITLTLTLTGAVTPPATGFTGKLMIDPDSVHHFVYDRDNDGDGKRDPAYLAGVGGPEGFLYESPARKQTIINKLLKSSKLNMPVNGIYFHATRSFGGDGNGESPFVIKTDPRSGLDPQKMAAWRVDLKRLDDAGIILWFNLLDDHSVPYGCKFNADYQKYARDIVNQFKDLKHVVWVTQEEYRWTDGAQANCSLSDNDDRQRGLAAAIRAADAIHPIATHHMVGQPMQFGSDANIGVFSQQTRTTSATRMHDESGLQGWGDWVYVMAEGAWHKSLIKNELLNGSGRTPMRQSNWATAMSGGYVMIYNAFECGSGQKPCNSFPSEANSLNPDSDPTDDILDDLRRLQDFMETTPFNRMAPLFANNGALTNAKRDGTKYILANQSAGLYILYGDTNTTKLGVNAAPQGTYKLEWFDPVDGTAPPAQTGTVGANGIASFTKPAGIGNEAVLYMRKM